MFIVLLEWSGFVGSKPWFIRTKQFSIGSSIFSRYTTDKKRFPVSNNWSESSWRGTKSSWDNVIADMIESIDLWNSSERESFDDGGIPWWMDTIVSINLEDLESVPETWYVYPKRPTKTYGMKVDSNFEESVDTV